jgi:hypothetical protein
MQTRETRENAQSEEQLEEVDIALLRHNLSLSYEERIEKHEDARELLELLRTAGERAREKSRKTS